MVKKKKAALVSKTRTLRKVKKSPKVGYVSRTTAQSAVRKVTKKRT